jgi:hypothetical protein
MSSTVAPRKHVVYGRQKNVLRCAVALWLRESRTLRTSWSPVGVLTTTGYEGFGPGTSTEVGWFSAFSLTKHWQFDRSLADTLVKHVKVKANLKVSFSDNALCDSWSSNSFHLYLSLTHGTVFLCCVYFAVGTQVRAVFTLVILFGVPESLGNIW